MGYMVFYVFMLHVENGTIRCNKRLVCTYKKNAIMKIGMQLQQTYFNMNLLNCIFKKYM